MIPLAVLNARVYRKRRLEQAFARASCRFGIRWLILISGTPKKILHIGDSLVASVRLANLSCQETREAIFWGGPFKLMHHKLYPPLPAISRLYPSALDSICSGNTRQALSEKHIGIVEFGSVGGGVAEIAARMGIGAVDGTRSGDTRGYWVTPQVKVGQYRIDLVAEGHNDTRLAVECDGDRYHGSDKQQLQRRLFVGKTSITIRPSAMSGTTWSRRPQECSRNIETRMAEQVLLWPDAAGCE